MDEDSNWSVPSHTFTDFTLKRTSLLSRKHYMEGVAKKWVILGVASVKEIEMILEKTNLAWTLGSNSDNFEIEDISAAADPLDKHVNRLVNRYFALIGQIKCFLIFMYVRRLVCIENGTFALKGPNPELLYSLYHFSIPYSQTCMHVTFICQHRL